MITESYVTFDTARMLEQAGFDEACDSTFNTDGKISYMGNINSTLPYGYISRSTQQLAARWLREAHDIHILVTPDISSYEDGTCVNEVRTYMLACFTFKDNKVHCDYNTNYFDTYESALEAGLQQALRQITKTDLQSD